MKTIHKVITLAFFLSFIITNAQTKQAETHSIEIDKLLTYIAEHHSSESTDNYNLTVLLQTPKRGFTVSQTTRLTQAFGFLLERLTLESNIAFLSYSGINGIALDMTPVHHKTIILNTLSEFKISKKTKRNEGLNLAYSLAQEHYKEDAVNRILIVRMLEEEGYRSNATTEASSTTNKRGVLLTALGILPELIYIFKN